MISICHKNIDKEIPKEIAENSIFEIELGKKFDISAFYEFEHPIYKKIKLRGRIDCITPDTIWEFKCVDILSIEHMIQLVLYCWIWQQLVSEENQNQSRQSSKSSKSLITVKDSEIENNLTGYDAYLAYRHKTTRNMLFQHRKCKLMNIRTGEIRELDTSSYLINEIVEIILAAKLRIRETLSDTDFIELARSRINKYVILDGHYKSMEELEKEDENNRPEIVF
jgi:hypothetical protein